jgi:hypothetical protein
MKTRTVALFLAANPINSKVVIDGLDVSSMTTGVSVESHVGEATRITLFLVGNCELFADVTDVETKPAAEDEQP